MQRIEPSSRNRLLAALSPDDYAALYPALEPYDLTVGKMLIESHQPISHLYFPESGIISVLASTVDGCIEVGMIGREGIVGLPAALGTRLTPHAYLVQGEGASLRIATEALREIIAARPSISRPLSLYAVAFLVQVAQTAYANASFTIEARLARWILMTQDRTEGDELFFTHEFLAMMLGVRRPGVTAATHILEGFGAIRAKRGLIIVRDRQKLCELADDSYQVAEAEYDRLMEEVG